MRKFFATGTGHGGGSKPSLDPIKREVSGLGQNPIDVNITNLEEGIRDASTDTIRNIIGPGTGFPVELQPPGFGADSYFTDTWNAIDASRFNFVTFQKLIDDIINTGTPGSPGPVDLGRTSLLLNSQAYNLLKFAVTEYVRRTLGIPDATSLPDPDAPGANLPTGVLPQYAIILRQLDEYQRATTATNNLDFRTRLAANRTELIWSYWHEEGMLVQTMNAIALRFQNKSAGRVDPLANLELDTLRPLANILFGYVQDAQHRLTISRRNYEYQYEYGIRLFGQAVPASIPVQNRTQFIEAFHNLLYRCTRFFELLDDRTKAADAFPLLSSLQELNLLLSEGMHNQYNDLSLTARVEMLMEQWILSRPEIKEFLRGKPMVAYREPWMGAVDAMKALQGWPVTSVRFYNDLANFGEDILLSLRFTPWERAGINDVRAWAIRFREPIQRYIHAYQAVTGVDLSADSVSVTDNKFRMPGILMQQKLQRDKQMKRIR